MLTSDHIGKLVSFNVYPAGIIPSQFQQVKVLDIFSPTTALRFADVASLHVNVYPTLPVGVPNTYTGYNYVQVELENGTPVILGLPWIDDSSIVVHDNVSIKVTISQVSAADVSRVREALISNGFPYLAVELI